MAHQDSFGALRLDRHTHTVIEPYDETLRRPWDGPWPRGAGAWVGGKRYFANAPTRFAPLLPANGRYNYGLKCMLADINRMLEQ